MLRKFRVVLVCFLASLVVLLFAQSAKAELDDKVIYERQAIIIYKFLGYVGWPQLTYSDGIKNIDLCIVGEDKWGAILDKIADRAKSQKESIINVKRGVPASAIDGCNVILVSGAANSNAVIESSKSKAVLTISDAKGFSALGGIVEFVKQEGGIGFKINNIRARSVGLKIDSELLDMAQK